MSGRTSDTNDGEAVVVASAFLPDGTRELVTLHYRSMREAAADVMRARVRAATPALTASPRSGA